MAETGGTTPDYSLSASTLAAVREAGVDPKVKGAKTKLGKALGKLGPSGTARAALGQGKALAGAAKEFEDFAAERKAEKEAKAKKAEDAGIKWDETFETMADRGSWASPDLFKTFTATEAKFRADYIAAVERGDNAAAQKMLREQGVRANSLNGWKETMTRAAEIQAKHPNLSKLIQGDAPGADGKRALIKAIADCKLEEQNVTFDKNGEMTFNIPGLTGQGTDYPDGVKSKDIDKIMTTVLSPVVRENSFRKTTETIEKTLAENPDASFDMNAAMRNQTKNFEIELHANPESAYSIMNDTWAGKTSLADDLEESILSGALAFEINLPTDSGLDQDGDGKVSLDEMPGYEDVKSEIDALKTSAGDPPEEGEDPSDEFKAADKNNDGVIDAKDLDGESIKKIIKGIQEDPNLLAEVAGGWSAMKQENIHKTKQEEAKQKELKELYDRVSGRGQLQLYTTPTIKDSDGKEQPNPNYNAALARYINQANKENEEKYLPKEEGK